MEEIHDSKIEQSNDINKESRNKIQENLINLQKINSLKKPASKANYFNDILKCKA